MIFLGDIRIKTMIELGLEDVRKNPWLLNDILGDTITNPYLRERYGSQIESCKQWLANNRIGIYLSEQQADKQEFPSIDIELGTSNEKADMKHMGDLSTESVKMIPNDINKPIPYVIKSAAGTYDGATGVFTFTQPTDVSQVAPGMILVDPKTGTGYIISGIPGANQVAIQTGLTLSASAYGVIPQYQYYETKIGHTFMQEPYRIICNAMDTQTLLWLHSIAVYSLLRYRQVLLEADGYAESLISSGKIYPNPDYSSPGQVIFARDINLTGQVENRWYMQPHRLLETASIGQEPSSECNPGLTGGVKILSNTTDTFENLKEVNWSALQDEAYRNE